MLKHAGTVVVGLTCLLAVAPAAAPVHLAYVHSDSMEPTIETFDGYVTVPAGDVSAGDIVTFRSSSSKGAYVTHRVVGRSDEGFITKGDNNPTTDQSAGAPHVHRDDIHGKVLTVRGEPVTIPGLGVGARFARTHWLWIAALLGAGLLVSLLRNGSSSRPSRSNPRVRDVVWPIFLIAFLGVIGFQFVGAQTHEVTYVATTAASDAPENIQVGESRSESLLINRSSVPLTDEVVGVDGMVVTDSARNATAISLSVRVPPPDQIGPVRTQLRVYRYPAVLPPGVLRALHAIHPLVAEAVTTGIVMGPLYAVYLLTIDGKQPLRSVQSRWMRKLRRKLVHL